MLNHARLLSPVARFGALSLLGALLTSSAFAACSGASPNIVCTSSNIPPILLNSPLGSAANPERASIYPSTNIVSGLSGNIASVQVRLNKLTHSHLHDLDMVLVSPTGQQFVFFSDVGFPGDTLPVAVSNTTVTLSDAALIDLPQGLLSPGTYKPKNFETAPAARDSFPAPAFFDVTAANSASPVGTATFASQFNAANPNGTWNLFIVMDRGPHNGSLPSWDLIFNLNPPGSTVTTLTSSANPSLIPLSGNTTYTLTAAVTAAGNPLTIGNVSFFDGTQSLGANIPLDVNGRASITVNTTNAASPFLAEGSHNLTVNYSGSFGFAASTGKLTQVVDRATLVSASLNRYCNTGPIALPATVNTGATPYPSKIFVTGLTGSTQSVTLALNGFTSPMAQDTSLLLVSPTGQKFVPLAFPGDSSSTASNVVLTLTDAATTFVPASGTIAAGVFLPTYNLVKNGVAPLSFVSPAPAGPYNLPAPAGASTFAGTFAGAFPNGTWSLYAISWSGSGPVGVRAINSGWCLSFGLSTDPVTTTTPSVSPSPSALNQPATISAVVASSGSAVNTQGAVTFKEGNTTLAGPILIDSLGTASFQKSDLSQGAHFLDAFYSGVPRLFGGSTGQVLHYVDAPTTNPSAGRFCNTTPLTFPNVRNATGSPYPTRINARGLAGTVAKVTVDLLGFSHQSPDDLDLMVTGPNGNSLIAFSDLGGFIPVSNLNITLDSTSAALLPNGGILTSGTFRPNDGEVNTDFFAAPAPVRGQNVFTAAISTFADLFNNSDPNGLWTLWSSVDNAGVRGGGSLSGGWCVNVTMNPPVLTLSKTHTGNFAQGQKGAQYLITVGSNGPGSTAGTITVVDTPTARLTVTAMSGSGWSCTVSTLTCTTTAPLAAGATLPPITVTVDVAASAFTPLVNSATVSSSGATGATASDSTIITPVPADLTLTVSALGDPPYLVGNQVSYSLTVKNISSVNPTTSFVIVNVSSEHPLAENFTFVNATGDGWSCILPNPIFSCARSAPIAPNSSAPPIIVSVSGFTAQSHENNFALRSAGSNNTQGIVTNFVTVVQPADLTITKTPNGVFMQGASANWTVTVLNSGPGATSRSFVVTDPIPLGFNLSGPISSADPAWSCRPQATYLTCTHTTPLAPQATTSFTVPVTLSPRQLTPVSLVASVSDGGELNTANNTTPPIAVTVVPAAPDLTVTQVAQGSNFQAGAPITYLITVTNAGSLPTSAPITMTDSSANILGSSITADASWACTSAQPFVCTRTTPMAANSSSVITLQGFTYALANTAVNTVTVAGGGESNTSNNSSSLSTPLTSVDTDIILTQAIVEPAPHLAGGQVTLSMTIKNISAVNPIRGLYEINSGFRPLLGYALSYVSFTGAGWQCAGAGFEWNCQNSTPIAPNSSAPPLNIVFSIAPSSVQGSAFSSNSLLLSGDTNTGNNTSSIQFDVVQPADLTISKTANGTFTQGAAASYTIAVANTGPGATARSVVVTDAIPVGLTVSGPVSSVDPAWTCTPPTATVLTCTHATPIASGATTAFTVPVKIAANAPSSVSLSATVSDGGELNTANNTTPPSTVNVITPPPDLTLTATGADKGPYYFSSLVTFSLTANNISTVNSTSAAYTVQGFVLDGAFPFKFNSVSGNGWNCVIDTVLSFSCTRSIPLAPNSSAPPIIVVVSIPSNSGFQVIPETSITGLFRVSGGGESNTLNNDGNVTIAVVDPADLTISKAPNGTFTQGGSGSYTVTVSNIGPGSTTRSVVVTDAIPAGLTVSGPVSSADPAWNCDPPSATTLTCTHTTALAPNSTTSFTVPVTISSTAASPLPFNASVSNGGETNTTNNTFTTTLPINSPLTAVTISVPPGISYTFNGQAGTGPRTFQVAPGSYTLDASNPQSLGAGVRSVLSSWSDGGAAAHPVTVGSTPITITGTFATQYQLTTSATPANGGTITPASGTWYDAGTVVNLTANPAPGFGFTSWTGPVANTTVASTTVTMDAPKTVSASFGTLITVNVVVPAGYIFASQGKQYTGPQAFNVATGGVFSVTAATQDLGPGARAILANWADGANTFLAPSYTTTVGSTPLTITGTFTTQYQLTTAVTPSSGGRINPPSGGYYDAGTVVNLSVNPATGFSFSNWTGPVANANTPATTVTMDAPKTVTANFAVSIAVTINVPAGARYALNGQVFTGPQTTSFPQGTPISLTADSPQSPGIGIQLAFTNWSDGVTTSITPGFLTTVGSTPLTITGTFKTQYQLTIGSNPIGGGLVTPAIGSFYDAGTVVNLTATPNSGYTFTNWSSLVANPTAASTTVTMDGPKVVTANFASPTPVNILVPIGVTYTLNGQSATGSRTFNLAPGTYTLDASIPTSPSTGVRSVFSSWSDGGAASHQITVGTTLITITGTFTTQYQLTTAVTPSSGGIVNPASGGYYDAGTVVNLSVNPATGFSFSNWTGPVANANTPATTVTMDAPKTVTAVFTPLTMVTVNVPAGIRFNLNGTDFTGGQTVGFNPGVPLVLTTTSPQSLAPGVQAVFGSWSDGATVTTNSTYSTTLGTTPITITGTFTTQYQLSTAAAPATSGGVAPASGLFYNAGTVVTLNASPASGFAFSNWSGSVVANPSSAATTVTMDAPKSVTANFVIPTAVTINVPAGVGYTFANQSVTGTQTFNLAPGIYSLNTSSFQNLSGGATRAVFASWSDGGAAFHSVTVGSTPLTITGTFTTQYQLLTSAIAANGGTVTPASGNFFDAGSVVNLTATPNSGFIFSGWIGAITNTSATATVTMDAPKSVIANFTTPTTVTVVVPPGVRYATAGQEYTGPQTFSVAPNSSFQLTAANPQPISPGVQRAIVSWTDGATTSFSPGFGVTVGTTPITITGTFVTQYQLTIGVTPPNGGGVIQPSGLFYNAGTVVNLLALPASGFGFNSWTGDPVSNPNSAATTVTMDAPKSVTANFGT